MSCRPFQLLAAVALFGFALALDQSAAGESSSDPCRLLTRAQITKATGLQVGHGQEGSPIAGAFANCWWSASDGTQIVVVVADTAHMQVTMDSQLQTGAAEIPGVGDNAVGDPGTDQTGGGYNLSVLDARGGVAVSILGSAGNAERTADLAKLIEARRAPPQ